MFTSSCPRKFVVPAFALALVLGLLVLSPVTCAFAAETLTPQMSYKQPFLDPDGLWPSSALGVNSAADRLNSIYTATLAVPQGKWIYSQLDGITNRVGEVESVIALVSPSGKVLHKEIFDTVLGAALVLDADKLTFTIFVRGIENGKAISTPTTLSIK